jgi:hypothetical protein
VKPAETARVLAAAASFDQRTVGQSDIAAWHAALSELEFADARDAVVRHYRATSERVMPVHVLHYAAEIMAEREAAEWEAANGHHYTEGEHERCLTCGFPKPNKRHLRKKAA